MKKFFRITGYCFLALVSATALRMYEAGWQRYAAYALLFAVTLRLLTLIFPRSAESSDSASSENN